MSNHCSSWLGDFSQPACFFFLNPHDFTHSRWIISKCQLHYFCAHPAVRITESRHVRPARCRGQLPRVLVSSPPCCRGEHLCQLFVRPTFRLAYSHGVRPDWFLRAAQFLMFPFVLGEFISRPTFDCPCERYLTMIPCMLYAEDFDCWATAWIDCSQAPSYCVNWLFTSCSTSSTSHRGFPCVLPNIYGSSRRSLGHLLDVDNPSTFSTTTRLAAIADIVANRRRKFMV